MPKNQKERLRNELLGWLSEKNCVLPSNCGKGANFFVTKFCDMLYYLHGQYSKIEFEIGKVKNVPKVFKTRFSGFNVPEKNKHGKRTRSNLSDRKLEEHSVSVRESIQSHVYLNQAPWSEVKLLILDVVSVVEQYCVSLRASRVKNKPSRETPRSEVEIKTKTTVLPVNKGRLHHALLEVEKQVEKLDSYDPLSIWELLPGCDRHRVYEVIEKLKASGLRINHKCYHYAYHTGGSKTSLHFVWKGIDSETDSSVIDNCLNMVEKVEEDPPVYGRQITKRNFQKAFGFVTDPVALCAIFKELTGDASAPSNLNERNQ